ncbi:hypothetical protein HF521_015265 [Silurus meridionalis]|uniref:Beta/gamma crystallin 'Greek key' domain-containing protein n=1 Tax=Silurus meridionalis TaxID=175797 RepID=A0A8T0A4Z5_SILME|nr:hypothetical protein HF521_015265 [Silurus meridionalis]
MRIYEKDNFMGQMMEVMDDCDSFMDLYHWSNGCMSCNVMDGHLLMYEHPHYRGRMWYFRPGEYRSFRDYGGMSLLSQTFMLRMSVAAFDCERPWYRGSYRMRIYEKDNFMGQMNEVMDDCDSFMDRYHWSNGCMSCNVMDGHWLMYEHPHYRGRMWYFRPGEYRSFRDYGGMRFMSMRRIMDSWY